MGKWLAKMKCLDCENWGFYTWGKYEFNEERGWTGCKLKMKNRSCPKNKKVKVEA
jgi:hypothetical protein